MALAFNVLENEYTKIDLVLAITIKNVLLNRGIFED